MTTSNPIAYQPQTDRLGLLNRGVTVAILCVLIFCLSVFIIAADPKVTLLLAAFCMLAGGRRLLTPAIWPLFAIVVYDLGLALFFPGSRPDIGLVFQHPLFSMDCMLLSALALGGQSVRRQHFLILGILAVSLFGVVGDYTGHDMISLLPLPMPEDDGFSQVTVIMGDVERVRGFFAESGVLGAVSLGFATMLGIGSIVLIALRVCARTAWVALIGAFCMGGAIFCLTITKSGLFMVAAGSFGFLAVLLSARNPRCRAIAVVALAGLLLGGAAFLVAGPPSLSGYFRGEILAAVHPEEMGASMASSHAGMITRYKCWLLAFSSLRQYPLGVGPYGLGAVVGQVGDASLNNEMRLLFMHDIFGLKNALANLIAECGVVGIGLLSFWLWTAFIQPIRHYLADGTVRGAMIAGIYGASALSSVVFLFSCELYPSFAFLLVLKFHADAIAQACANQQRPDLESIELIG